MVAEASIAHRSHRQERMARSAEAAETATMSFLVVVVLVEALSGNWMRPSAFQVLAYGMVQALALIGLVVAYISAAQHRARIEQYGTTPEESRDLAAAGRWSNRPFFTVSIAAVVVLAAIRLIDPLLTR
jgi:F0F1-type ATP synthase membrane subunit c/vacuolar-type H+-ATPase subunit K